MLLVHLCFYFVRADVCSSLPFGVANWLRPVIVNLLDFSINVFAWPSRLAESSKR